MSQKTEFGAGATPDPLREKIVINTLGSLHDPNRSDLGRGDGSAPPETSRKVIDDAHAAGVTAINLTVGYALGDADAYAVSVQEVKQWEAIVEAYPHDLIRILNVHDILKAKREGKIGLIFGFQSSEMFGISATRIDEFAEAGVRIMQLTYNTLCAVGGGALVEDSVGLTPFGRTVVARLNARNVIVDLSHSNRQTCLDAIECSTQPVAITHTGCRALVDVPRNKSDDELRRVAEMGGYVGIYFMPFLAIGRNATGDDVVAHIEHAIQICGEDHVGVGTDTSYTRLDDLDAFKISFAKTIETRRELGISAPGERPDVLPFVVDMTGTEQMRDLALRLARRGHSEARIDKILGINFLRYAQEVWSN